MEGSAFRASEFFFIIWAPEAMWSRQCKRTASIFSSLSSGLQNKRMFKQPFFGFARPSAAAIVGSGKWYSGLV